MSTTELEIPEQQLKSRKRNVEAAEIEIDVEAPEPPSKKALRKAKKAKISPSNDPALAKDAADSSSTQPTEAHAESSTKRSLYGIWIGNLAFSTTKDDLVKFLTTDPDKGIQRERITRIHLPLGPPKFGKPVNKGFAYVDFLDEESLTRGLAFTEGFLGGRRVLVKNAHDFQGRPGPKKDKDEAPTNPPSKRIFIGNLDFDTTVDDLEAHFGTYGAIAHTKMATFEDSGKCKGFAWLEFDQLASAEAAMRGWRPEGEDSAEKPTAPHTKQHPSRQRAWVHKLHGRKLRMEFAEDKTVRYEKRFGKGSKHELNAAEDGEAEGAAPRVQAQDEPRIPSSTRRVKQKTSGEQAQPSGKYSQETVQRLTGAIVEGKGQRKVFD